MSQLQYYDRLYSYIHDYQNLIYNYYSKHAIAYLVTYYSIDKDGSILENEDLMGGFYERIGNLSGLRWNKYLLLPVFYIEETNTTFDGNELGLTKLNDSHLVIPSSYGITPLVGDMIKFEQSYLRTTNDTYPIFIVSGKEKSANTDKTFWKLKIESSQSHTTEDLDRQVSNIYTFFEYTKKIYNISDAIFLTKLLYKNSVITEVLNQSFDDNSGFYFI